ncbi:MAG: sensor histidine kinase, partial [Spirochaetota bacterium]
VKNNMQLIMSIVHLQRSSAEDLDEFCERLEARIRAMAFVHELLYQSPDLSTIGMRELLQGLTAGVAQAAKPPRVTVHSEQIALPMERAIPLSLITNELLANAVKHAHDAASPGRIDITIAHSGHSIELTVRDSGPGFPEGFVPARSAGLGMRLVTALAQQLDGAVTVTNRDGGCVIVRVPDTTESSAPCGTAATQV